MLQNWNVLSCLWGGTYKRYTAANQKTLVLEVAAVGFFSHYHMPQNHKQYAFSISLKVFLSIVISFNLIISGLFKVALTFLLTAV